MSAHRPKLDLMQANQLVAAGRLGEAEAVCREVLRKEPKNVGALHLLGSIRTRLGAIDEAIDILTRATKLSPASAPLHVDLGIAYGARGDWSSAAASHRTAIALEPGFSAAHFRLAQAMAGLNDPEGAIAAYEACIRIDPNDVASFLNLGNLYKAQQRYEEALRFYDRAVVLMPTLAMGYRNIAATLRETGRLHAAMAVTEYARRIAPDDKAIAMDYAAALLLRGDLAQGWAAYEQRFDNPEEVGPRRPRPPAYWDGGDLADRRILVWTEQSPGDEIMHANMLGDVIARAKHCVVECSRRMAPIFARSFPSADVVAYESYEMRVTPASAVDVQISIASLGQFLRPTLDSFPKHGGYLEADTAMVARLRERYRAAKPGNKLVGLSWRSTQVPGKSLHLLDFAPILQTPGVTFVNLQYGDCTADLAAVKESLGVEIVHDADIDQLKDMDAFFAQVGAMDLVISTSNTAVHTAGAQGIPTWVLLPFARGLFWYWLTARSDSPWYPSLRLIRQNHGQPTANWAQDMIPAVAHDLAAWAAGGARVS